MKQTVVVVDDDPEILAVISNMLEQEYEVSVFSDGQKALDYLRSGVAPSLLMSDLRMPGLNGFMVLSEARRILPGLKTMLFSGFIEPTSESEKGILSRFANDVMRKPLRFQELMSKIHRLID